MLHLNPPLTLTPFYIFYFKDNIVYFYLSEKFVRLFDSIMKFK